MSLKLQEMCILAIRNLNGKNAFNIYKFMLKMYFHLFLEVKKTACYLCGSLNNLFDSEIFSR